MEYFAYGSNMLEERLKEANRVPNATFVSVGIVQGYTLRFNKLSDDYSGKCNIVPTHAESDIVYGVVFDIPDNEITALDVAEGFGHGYDKENVLVRFTDGSEREVMTYIAVASAIDENLSPYTWYHNLVVAGAEQHNLPKNYTGSLLSVGATVDPRPNRRRKLEAEAVLDTYHRNRQP